MSEIPTGTPGTSIELYAEALSASVYRHPPRIVNLTICPESTALPNILSYVRRWGRATRQSGILPLGHPFAHVRR